MPVTCWLERLNAFELPGFGTWNPLTDDGDAMRLAVKLNITWEAYFRFIDDVPVIDCQGEVELQGSDPCAATRRAIVRAAAEIGREMK